MVVLGTLGWEETEFTPLSDGVSDGCEEVVPVPPSVPDSTIEVVELPSVAGGGVVVSSANAVITTVNDIHITISNAHNLLSVLLFKGFAPPINMPYPNKSFSLRAYHNKGKPRLNSLARTEYILK